MMKKFLTIHFARRLVISGAVLFALSIIVNLAVAFTLYGKASDCPDGAACSIDWQLAVSDVARIVGYVGIVFAVVGLILWLIKHYGPKNPKVS